MDPIIRLLRESLPTELVEIAQPHILKLQEGDYASLLDSAEARRLFSPAQDVNNTSDVEESHNWNDLVFHRLGDLLSDRSRPEQQALYFCIGYAALLLFIQTNVTGPPLQFAPEKILFQDKQSLEKQNVKRTQQALLAGLTVDGIAAYKLTPHVELLCLAEAIVTCPPILKNIKPARWVKVRAASMHQRLLSEASSTLQDVIYEDLDLIRDEVFANGGSQSIRDIESEFILERATIHIHHGLDKLARSDLLQASNDRNFQYALTGRLGKRTKFQERDISQLVVLAKSPDKESQESTGVKTADASSTLSAQQTLPPSDEPRPENLDLNDDTLLEKISFTDKIPDGQIDRDGKPLPPELATLDPSNQPQLEPLDSSILLSYASSITNTSPEDGLTREETLPYATRVLEGGSSNWQVYTQALLVRSRIEGYRSRTIERGLLQLQALVDQVIADTTDAEQIITRQIDTQPEATTFLPRPKPSESAPVTERVRYVFQLATPTRWDLEAELAARWVQLGGLRSALEIYERLELWAEAALCWAATEREDKAKALVRRQLFHPTKGIEGQTDHADENETWEGPPREPPPMDAPRLYCILGDLDQSIEMYETAWNVSKQRYARAQRSIGRHFLAAKDYLKAAEAYSKSLKVNQLNEKTWFALGCCLIELEEYERAVHSFSRCVQLDESDAEAWSNLAASLLRLDPRSTTTTTTDTPALDDEANDSGTITDISVQLQTNRHDALKAFQRAASLKHDSYRIWSNVLVTAASIRPPDYTAALSAQKRIIDLRGATDGEKCIDVEILEDLVQHAISSADNFDASRPGVVRMTVKFIDENVVPLITSSTELWRLVSRLAVWRQKPASALEAEEKAWRAVTAQPGWETESERRWNAVVEATVRLCDSYESLGPRERTEGLGAGEVVAKDWRFKARSAIRGIMSRGRDSWADTEGWERLKLAQDGLKG